MTYPPPRDAILAATHHDPYPFYETLAPFAWSPSIEMWVAARANAVRAVLAHDACVVRPPSEPVPRALAGSPAGTLFSRLVRMRDDRGHAPLKAAISRELGAIELTRLAGEADAHARTLAPAPNVGPEDVLPFARRLSSFTLGSMLGLPAWELARTAEAIGAWVAGGDPAREAADTLLALFRAHRPNDDEDRVANAIGLLAQAYDATAGLVGNTLVALLRDDALRHRIMADPSALGPRIEAVAARDPSAQNTRRFVVRSGVVANHEVQAGDAILVLLAAATQEEAASRTLAFGSGAHACPGSRVAQVLARAAVSHLLDHRARLDLWAYTYLPSVNLRIPVFTRAPPEVDGFEERRMSGG